MITSSTQESSELIASNAIETVSDETVEGYEGGLGMSGYPLDELAIRGENRTTSDVVRRMKQKRFHIDPEFQRDFVWKKDKQSRLIESVLMRIPLPVFYVAEDNEGRLVVVDGRQRLTTLENFIDNKFSLDLPDRPEFNGKKFETLDQRLQNRVEDCQLHFYIIDKDVPESARLDIFERVNGGEALTRQQMRNAIYNGVATEFLKQEASTDLFKSVTGGSLNAGKMQDREFVNRFCSFFILPLDEYKGDMDKWLAKGLVKLKEMTNQERDDLRDKFRQSLQNNQNLFGEHAFRKHTPEQPRRNVINASLFDVMSVQLSKVDSISANLKKDQIKESLQRYLKAADFLRSITYGPNSTAQVIARFNFAKKMFDEVFNAN